MTTTTDTSAMTLAQKSDRILAQTRGLSGATPNATRLIEELRLALESNRNDVQRLTAERDEAKERNVRLLSQLQEYEVREF
jgi:ATP-dependent protease HslVU (ClpYQ) peptidase subunit